MKVISVRQLQEKLSDNEPLLLLDVRSIEERNEAHIKGDIHLSLEAIRTFQLDSIEADKKKPIVCYCRSGKRSLLAALFLLEAGFEDVASLSGGFEKWATDK